MSTVDENIEVSINPKIKTVPTKLGTVLTEHEFNTLDKMLASKDTGDHRMAQAILNQCDVQKSIYWIWRLARKNPCNMVYLRTKASREFKEAAGLFHISHMWETEFALYLIKQNWLTEEIYQKLKAEILVELADRNKDENLYEISIVIKDKYREFDPESVLIHLPTT